MPTNPLPPRGEPPGDLADATGELRNLVRLWLQHRRELILRSLRLLGHHEADAEDAVGNALLRLLENRRRLGPIQNPKAFFHHLVFNSCMDLHRRHRRGARGLSTEEFDDETIACGATVEDQYRQVELQVLLMRALSSLPADLRQMLVARASGTSYSVIAAQACITQANARKRIQQARAILRQRIV